MPTYDFRCPNGHQFERFYRKISDSPATVECSVCGAVAERLVSGGAGLLFKGSGFYLTDYGRNAHRGGPAPSGNGEPGKASSGNAGGEGGSGSSGGDSGAAAAKAPKSDASGASSTPAKPKSGTE
ncbi:MAG TPA: zinc ribbon domain-containing protein [Gemmatimonadaceae bacterium]|nr:zinc ribbon domain-containing protein [Gemmatimonadaceae bacterium]